MGRGVSVPITSHRALSSYIMLHEFERIFQCLMPFRTYLSTCFHIRTQSFSQYNVVGVNNLWLRSAIRHTLSILSSLRAPRLIKVGNVQISCQKILQKSLVLLADDRLTHHAFLSLDSAGMSSITGVLVSVIGCVEAEVAEKVGHM